MANLIIPMGLPGSGKSTWTKTMLDGKYSTISSDAIRMELFGSLRAAHDVDPDQKRVNNARVWDIYYRKIEEALTHNMDVVADATNLRDFARLRLLDIAERTNAKTHLFVFNNVNQAFTRNAERDEDRIVPGNVMDLFKLDFEESLVEINNENYDSITVIASLR